MQKMLYALLVFTALPYVTFLASPMPASYLQPFALVCAFIICLINSKKIIKLAKLDDFAILILIFFGLIFILFIKIFNAYLNNDYSALFEFNFGYLSPISFLIIYHAYKSALNQSDLKNIAIIFKWMTLLYFFVGLAQIIINPNFLTFLVGGNKTGLFGEAGGRGTISLASEPSYYAFQMIAIATILALCESRFFAILAILQIFFIAISSTGISILIISIILLLFINKKYQSISLIVLSVLCFILYISKDSLLNGTRLSLLLDVFLNFDFSYFIFTDESTSERFVHAAMPYFFSLKNLLLPNEFFHETWVHYLESFNIPWFYNLEPNSRIMSGFGEILVLYGFFIIPFIIKFTKTLLVNLKSDDFFLAYLILCTFLIMFATYSFSTPTVALIFVLCENKNQNKIPKL